MYTWPELGHHCAYRWPSTNQYYTIRRHATDYKIIHIFFHFSLYINHSISILLIRWRHSKCPTRSHEISRHFARSFACNQLQVSHCVTWCICDTCGHKLFVLAANAIHGVFSVTRYSRPRQFLSLCDMSREKGRHVCVNNSTHMAFALLFINRHVLKHELTGVVGGRNMHIWQLKKVARLEVVGPDQHSKMSM